MAVLRDRPYLQFNFLVDLGTGTTDGPGAGFQECSQIGMSVDVIEYRNGNSKENSVQKLTGLNKATDVTLKRGIIGSLDLYQWLNDIRNGDQNAFRTVVIHPAERGPHAGRADVEAATRADRQARQRPAECEGLRRRDRRADARIRAAGDGVRPSRLEP
jgi:phage tail-like protein